MKLYLKCATLIFVLISFLSCMQKTTVNESDPLALKSRFSLPCQVLKIAGPLITVRVDKPALERENEKLALTLARGIIENSYFLEGKETRLGNTPVKIVRIFGHELLVEVVSEKHALVVGERYDILLDRRIIAIRDFEVVRGRDKSVATYVQEDVTTALVNSGQFNVLERFKLAAVLGELKLSQTGLMDSNQAQKVGKLLGADMILTGTLAAAGENWNANLRLINAETGLIISAINAEGPLHELKGETYRESGNISGSFDDDADLAGWIMGEQFRDRIGEGGASRIYLDKSQGAHTSATSMAMDFKLGTRRIVKNKAMLANLTNLMKRDLYNYNGIEFYIKGSKKLTVVLQINDKPGSETEEEGWFRTIQVTPQWKKEKISFNTMSINKRRAAKLKTNQVFDLTSVESINWLIIEKQNRPGTEGTIWIDEVRFY